MCNPTGESKPTEPHWKKEKYKKAMIQPNRSLLPGICYALPIFSMANCAVTFI